MTTTRVIRYDIGTLKPPEVTPQGFLKVEGYASRVGVFEYLRKDGTTRRELRLPEDVFEKEALAGYEGAPITNNHPSKKVTAKTAKAVSVGHIQGKARKDGDHVAVKTVISDESAIAAVKKGKRGLSTGYEVDLEETSGEHPIYGRYDAIQRNLKINHLAIVEFPRAGQSARLRMDETMRMDSFDHEDAMMLSADVSLTTSSEGHQHSINRKGYDNSIRTSGTTSYAMIEDADREHTHDWFLNEDGTITISENAGHTHEVSEEDNATSEELSAVTKTDGRSTPVQKGRRAMPTPEDKKDPKKPGAGAPATPAPKKTETKHDDGLTLVAAIKELDSAKGRADAAEKRAAAAEARADRAEGEVDGLKLKLAEAESDRTDSAIIEEKDLKIRELEEEVETEKKRADTAEDPKRFHSAVVARVDLEKRAAPLIGTERLDMLDDREIMEACLAKVGRTDMADKSIEYVRGVFDNVIEKNKSTQRQLDKMRALAQPEERADAAAAAKPRAAYIERQQNGWKTPTINARKGA